MQRTLNRYLPGWADSPAISLLIERESLAAVVTPGSSCCFLFFCAFPSVGMASRVLGSKEIRVRTRFRLAAHAFVSKNNVSDGPTEANDDDPFDSHPQWIQLRSFVAGSLRTHSFFAIALRPRRRAFA